MSKKPYYLTTAIAYTSGKPHIGNTYEIVLADAIVRYKRFQGYDVRFQTGTDEHGQKIELKAQEAGITPKEFVDGVSTEIKRIWDLMNTSYDRFIRTTDEEHEKQVQKIFKKLYDKGDIYKGLEMMSSVNNENAEDERKKKIVKSAIKTLSASELQAVKAVFAHMDGMDGILVASRIADDTGITRSVIVNALKKFDSAGVISTKSSGMKGTKIKVLNEVVYDELKKLED